MQSFIKISQAIRKLSLGTYICMDRQMNVRNGGWKHYMLWYFLGEGIHFYYSFCRLCTVIFRYLHGCVPDTTSWPGWVWPRPSAPPQHYSGPGWATSSRCLPHSPPVSGPTPPRLGNLANQQIQVLIYTGKSPKKFQGEIHLHLFVALSMVLNWSQIIHSCQKFETANIKLKYIMEIRKVSQSNRANTKSKGPYRSLYVMKMSFLRVTFTKMGRSLICWRGLFVVKYDISYWQSVHFIKVHITGNWVRLSHYSQI